MRILLVTHSFAPLNKISSLRLVHWVKYWSQNGNHVTVLTTEKYSFDGDLNLDVVFDPEVVELYEVPYLKSKSKIVKNTSSSSAVFQSLRRVNQFIRNYIGSLFDIHDLWVKPATKIGEEILQGKNFDCIVSSFSPPCSHMVAANLSKKSGVPWLADYRDLWADNHIGSAKFPFSIIEKWKERSTVGEVAKVITTVSQPLAKSLQKRFNQPVAVVENGYDPEEYLSLNLDKRFSNKVINIVYAGNIYPNRRDPEPLLNVIASNKLNFKVHFFGPDNSLINSLKHRYHGIVETHGNVNRKEILNVMFSADILLLLESGAKDADGVLTGKLFEYFAIGKPILGIGFDNSVLLGKVLERSRAGTCFFNQEVELLKYLQSFKDTPFNMDLDFISQYRRDIQAERILDLIR